jgi:ribose transport system permease protein
MIRKHSREIGLAVLIVLAVVLFSILYPISFFSWSNAQAILRNLAVDGILAVGMMMLLVGGMFDLSVGSLLSMTGVIVGWLMKNAGWPVPMAIGTGLAIAAAGGGLNGFLVAKIRVNALITTLATMGIYQGVSILIGGPGIVSLPKSFTRLGQSEYLGLQTPVWLLLVLALVGHYLLAHTRYFRQLYYIGSNARAAHLSGINVEKMQIMAFTMMGLIAGVAGIMYAARFATAVSNAGVGAELRVITAVILGGASLNGGKGTIAGAMIGVVFMAVVNNVLIIARVSSYWQGIILGVVLILAVSLDSLMNREEK